MAAAARVRGVGQAYCRAQSRRGGHTVVVPTDARRQMLLELMTSATLVEVVELMFDALDAGTPAHEQHVLCCDEFSVWAS